MIFGTIEYIVILIDRFALKTQLFAPQKGFKKADKLKRYFKIFEYIEVLL